MKSKKGVEGLGGRKSSFAKRRGGERATGEEGGGSETSQYGPA